MRTLWAIVGILALVFAGLFLQRQEDPGAPADSAPLLVQGALFSEPVDETTASALDVASSPQDSDPARPGLGPERGAGPETSGRQTPATPSAAADSSSEVASKPRAKSARTSASDDFVEVSFFELSAYVYPLTESETIPRSVKKLHGQPVILRGFMVPLDYQRSKVKHFILSPTLSGCCYGEVPEVNQVVYVEMDRGIRVLKHKWIKATGLMDIGEKYDEVGDLASIYRLQGQRVQASGYKE